jgi:hypothetical protein
MGIDSTENFQELTNYRLANLKLALVWALENSIQIRGSTSDDGTLPSLSPPKLDMSGRPSLDGLELHSFDFIWGMSDEEWEEWMANLKGMIMGAGLGGLKPGPFYEQNRFCRDPDNVCGRVHI